MTEQSPTIQIHQPKIPSQSPQIYPPSATTAAPNVRPRIMLNIPGMQSPLPNSYYSPAVSPYLNAGLHSYPSQFGGGPPQWPPSTPYASPFVSPTYPAKAGEFMFKQFEGFKDFTKSGLNMGEKSAFYIYNKFSRWSKRWFTHIFLFLVVFLYSVAGAFLFSAVEGGGQEKANLKFADLKSNFTQTLYSIAQEKDTLMNITRWEQEVTKEIHKFQNDLVVVYKSGYFDIDANKTRPTWSFWNSMFYCGTIYTTIDESYTPDKSSEKSRSNSMKKKHLSSSSPCEKTNEENEMSKFKLNLRRFEDERRRFELEREKFEREKRDSERARCRRLEEFERKRLLRPLQETKEYETLAKAAEISNQQRHQIVAHVNIRHDDAIDGIDLPFQPTLILRKKSLGSMLDRYKENGMHAPNGIQSTEIIPAQPSDEKPVLKIQSLLSRIIFGKRNTTKKNSTAKTTKTVKEFKPLDMNQPLTLRYLLVESYMIWKQLIHDHPIECQLTRQIINRCIIDFILLCIFFGAGGLIFRFVEGAFENFYKCGVRRVKRDFVDHLWHSSHNLREEDWKSMAIGKLRIFEEELHVAHEAGSTSYSGLKAWTFINGVVYCMTIVTTIGYGHIYPATNTGRAITIVYAIIGIPMFLILLADFGKLFTRGIKFLWAYVRRLYYTGSLRRVRKQAQVQEMIRGMNIAYEIATFRRPSFIPKEPEIDRKDAGSPQSNLTHLAPPSNSGTPTTPIPPDIDIDDEFNLPISLAFIILLAYIFFGAAIYSIWEEKWSFFEACYFVFISMSTIGFGDYVPQHPIYMMMSIIYLVFGLALTSMCINVVQVKLSDSFLHATAKIGATIGLSMAEEEARSSQNISPVPDLASVHSYGQQLPQQQQKLADGDNRILSVPRTEI